MRTIVIGDIHGCVNTLQKLLKRVSIRENDRIIFLGDYIDRGPDSVGVVEFIMDLKSMSGIEVIPLKGNHEQMFLEVLENSEDPTELSFYTLNGGSRTLFSYSKWEEVFRKNVFEEMIDFNVKFDEDLIKSIFIPKRHIDFLKSLRPYYKDDEFFYVHASVYFGVPLNAHNENNFLWGNESFYCKTNVLFEGKKVIYGHKVTKDFIKPDVYKNRIGIDCGCGKGGNLCALVIEKDFDKDTEIRYYIQEHEKNDRPEFAFDWMCPKDLLKIN